MKGVAACILGASGFDRAAQGVVGAAQRLAGELQGAMHVIVLGPADEGCVSALRSLAGEVVLADCVELAEYHPEAYLNALEQICRANPFSVILLGCDSRSQELTPRLAHRLEGSSLADVTRMEMVGDRLRMARAAYGGKAAAVYELRRTPAVACLRARSFEPARPAQTPGELARPELSFPGDSKIRVAERHVEQRAGIPLEDAAIVVAGGRGLGGPEGFESLRNLASAMGAALGSSRVACDEGWAPPSLQVGQTGKKVAPQLYLAVGISGAAQHLLGMADSRVIAAINTDKDAPIFNHCHFGIVEDYRKVVPPLAGKLAAWKR